VVSQQGEADLASLFFRVSYVNVDVLDSVIEPAWFISECLIPTFPLVITSGARDLAFEHRSRLDKKSV
jgi:hypothetical protein